jgi:hypothetical protein
MAKGNAKKRAEDNVARLSALRRAILFAVGAHFLVRLVVYRGTTTWWVHWPLFAFAACASWFCYASLRNVGAPTWDASGALVDGGGDLTLGGMSSYYHDIIYISVFCLVAAALVSDWIWLALLSIPCVRDVQAVGGPDPALGLHAHRGRGGGERAHERDQGAEEEAREAGEEGGEQEETVGDATTRRRRFLEIRLATNDSRDARRRLYIIVRSHHAVSICPSGPGFPCASA